MHSTTDTVICWKYNYYYCYYVSFSFKALHVVHDPVREDISSNPKRTIRIIRHYYYLFVLSGSKDQNGRNCSLQQHLKNSRCGASTISEKNNKSPGRR
jgi:hypothetical protein